MLSAKNFVVSAAAAAFVLAAGAAPSVAGHEEAGAGAHAAKAEKTEKKRRGGCPFRRSITGYSVIDDRHFVLESARKDYLITLSPGCRGLHFEMAIAIKSTPAAGICVERGDRVILDNHFTCWIQDIERVENKKEARAIVEERTAEEEEEGESG